MASTTEVGNAKNVALFEDLISFVSAYTPPKPYDPSKNSIKLPNLILKKTDADNVMLGVDQKSPPFIIASDQRKLVFSVIPALASKIRNAVIASDAPAEFLPNVTQITRKLRGSRAKPKQPVDPATPPDEVPVNISVSQRSYDSQIALFGTLIELLNAQPAYAPNEDELKVVKLTELHQRMKDTNTAVINAYTDVTNARIARDKVLYDPETGMLRLVKDVKAYVKSLFGGKSIQFLQLSALKFKKPKKIFV
jgi:hypothetical protein